MCLNIRKSVLATYLGENDSCIHFVTASSEFTGVMQCVVTVLVAVLASGFLQPVKTVNPLLELRTQSSPANGK